MPLCFLGNVGDILVQLFLVELFLVDSLTHLFAVIYINRFIFAKRVYYLFIYFTANALVFPREFGGYSGSVIFG